MFVRHSAHEVQMAQRSLRSIWQERTLSTGRTSTDSPHLDQTVAPRPAHAQSHQGPADFHLRYLGIGSLHHSRGLALGQFQQLPVANQIGYAEAWHPSLSRAEEFSRPAQFEIEFGDLEA